MKAYQLKITIKNSHPPIWRRVIVPSGLTFSQLIPILNEVMGWCGYHMSMLEFYHLKLQIEEEPEDMEWFEGDILDAADTKIDSLMESEEWFTYTYDFGDDWEHRVEIEKIIDQYEKTYPTVLKYKGDTPYEDCGGIYGYYELLEILEDESHPEHNAMKEWTEGHFHTDYDLEDVNDILKSMELFDEQGNALTQRDIYERMYGL